MIRATTPTFIFSFPDGMYESSKEILITFKQGTKIVFDKYKKDLMLQETENGNEYKITLTQKEANLFDSQKVLKIQARFLYNDGEVSASIEKNFSVSDVLNDKELT